MQFTDGYPLSSNNSDSFPSFWSNTGSDRTRNEETGAYARHIARLRSIYPNSRIFKELHNYFIEHQEGRHASLITIADYVNGAYSWTTVCSADQLRYHLSLETHKGLTTRLILLEYKNKRALDSEVLDLLGTLFKISPIFLYKHITLNRFGSETPFFATERDGLELKIQRNFVSSLICSSSSASSSSEDASSTGRHKNLMKAPRRFELTNL